MRLKLRAYEPSGWAKGTGLALDCPGALVRATADKDARTIEMIGSTEDMDRYREIIAVSGWDVRNYRLNPVFLFGHDYSQPPIGKALKVVKDAEAKVLRFLIEFATAEDYPWADTIFRLYANEFMRTTSVGFIPLTWEENADFDPDDPESHTRTFLTAELLELSAVPIPANPHALAQALSKGLIREPDFNRLRALGVPVAREVLDLSHYTAVAAERQTSLDALEPERADTPAPAEPPAADAREAEPPVETPAAPDPAKTMIVLATSEDQHGQRLILATSAAIEALVDSDTAVEFRADEGVDDAVLEQARHVAVQRTLASLPASLPVPPEGTSVLAVPALAAKVLATLVGRGMDLAAIARDILEASGEPNIKAGAVLNTRNLARVRAIRDAAAEILAEAEPAEDLEAEPERAVEAPPAAAEAPPVPAEAPGAPDEPREAPPATPSDPPASTEALEDDVIELEDAPPAGGDTATPAPPSPEGQEGESDLDIELEAGGAQDVRAVMEHATKSALASLTGDVRAYRRRK